MGQSIVPFTHYNDVIMTTIASQITSPMVVYSTVYSDPDQRKHQSSASLAFVWGIHRDRWIPRTKGQLRGNVSIWWRHHVTQINWNGTWISNCLFCNGCNYSPTPNFNGGLAKPPLTLGHGSVISSTPVSDSHLSPPGALQSRRASLQRT